MTSLLSQALINLRAENLPLVVLGHRQRILKAQASFTALEAALSDWGPMLEAAREDLASDNTHQASPPAGSPREATAQALNRALMNFSRRIWKERPSLSGYEALIDELRSPQVYTPQVFKATPFQERSADTHPEYVTMISDARISAVGTAEEIFVFDPPRYGEGAPFLLGGIAVVALLLGFTGAVGHPVASDALTIGGLNAIILAFLARVHTERQRQVQLEAFTRQTVRSAEQEIREKIRRTESERMALAMEESREKRQAFEAEDRRRRMAFDRHEGARLAQLEGAFSGKSNDEILGALLPLPFPLRATALHRWNGRSRLEVRLVLPVHQILPPSVDGVWRPGRLAPSPADLAIAGQVPQLAAAFGLRCLFELFFHLPTLRSSKVTVVRPNPRGEGALRLLDVEAERDEMSEPLEEDDPLAALRSFHSRVDHANLNGEPLKVA